MRKVFLDTNVLLDFLLDRKPFNNDIAEIIEESINKSLQLCVSSVTVTHANYIIGRFEGVKSAKLKTKKILELVTVENVGETTVHKSTKSKFKDFENGVQNFCAVESNHKIITTRNVKDFKESKLAILTPKELLVRMKSWK
jgi:predicted nucleic acid-binding protein